MPTPTECTPKGEMLQSNTNSRGDECEKGMEWKRTFADDGFALSGGPEFAMSGHGARVRERLGIEGKGGGEMTEAGRMERPSKECHGHGAFEGRKLGVRWSGRMGVRNTWEGGDGACGVDAMETPCLLCPPL